MRGLIEKSLREVWLTTLIFGVALLVVQIFLGWVIPQFQDQVGQILSQFPWIERLISTLLGTDLGDEITAQVFQSFVWVHPVVMALFWAHEIVICTRVPAGEIDRGTADVLLGLPASRRRVYLAETIVWLASGTFVVAMAWIGFCIGAQQTAPVDRAPAGRVLLVLANLLCLYTAVGGVALLVSSLSNRRGRAVAMVFAIVVASFLLNFLAQFWEPAARVSFLGLLAYYEPASVMRSGGLDVGDVAVLLGVGLVAWIAGGEVFARRSICTV